MVTGLEIDMIKVFEAVGTKDEEGYRKQMLQLIRGMKGGIQKDRLWRIVMSQFRNYDEFEACVVGLLNAGQVRQYTTQGLIYLGAKRDEQETSKDS